jgi:hypothetical protein
VYLVLVRCVYVCVCDVETYAEETRVEERNHGSHVVRAVGGDDDQVRGRCRRRGLTLVCILISTYASS